MSAPTTPDFESDAFLALLTDALRSGPGSLSWSAAIERLREMDSKEADEFKLILEARDNLAKGKEYRSIMPGPGFTRKVMAGIEESDAQDKHTGPSTPAFVFIAAVLIIGVVLLVAFLLGRQPASEDQAGRLASLSFPTTAINADLTRPLNADFEIFGKKPITSPLGLGLRSADPENSADFQTGGIRLAKGFEPADTFAFEVGMNLRNPDGNANVRAQVFLSDASDRELAVEFTQGRFMVYQDGKHVGADAKAMANRNTLLMKVNEQFIDVQVNGHSIYTGPHGLDKTARKPGVRFFSKGANWGMDDLAIPIIRVLKP